MTEGNTPAFAAMNNIGDYQPGLTKRELIAAIVLSGWVASYGAGSNTTIAVKRAVKLADALIKELNKTTLKSSL